MIPGYQNVNPSILVDEQFSHNDEKRMESKKLDFEEP